MKYAKYKVWVHIDEHMLEKQFDNKQDALNCAEGFKRGCFDHIFLLENVTSGFYQVIDEF